MKSFHLFQLNFPACRLVANVVLLFWEEYRAPPSNRVQE